MCFDWDKKGYGGLAAAPPRHNNWAVSPVKVGALSRDQQALVEAVLKKRP